MRNYATNEIVNNHVDEKWSIDLADFSDLNKKGFRYIFIIIDNFLKYVSAIPLKNRNSQTITQEFSNIKLELNPIKLESDRGKECYNSIFQNFLKSKIIHHYSRLTDESPSVCERVSRTIRNLLKKPGFEEGNADWVSELSSVIKEFINTIHNSTKLTPIQASRKVDEKVVSNDLKNNREIQKPKFKLGQLVRTADIKRVFSKGDSTNYSYNLYAITEFIHDTIPSYRIDFLLERFNQNLLLPTILTLEENPASFERINFNSIKRISINEFMRG